MAIEFSRRSFLGGLSFLFAHGVTRTYAESVGAGKPNVSFGVLSDIHINPKAACDAVRAKMGLGPITAPHRYIETDILEKAFRWFDERQCDAVMIAGDMADDGLTSQLRAVADCWYKVFPKNASAKDGRSVEKLFIGGNHDFFGLTYSGGASIHEHWKYQIPAGEWLSKDMAKHWKDIFVEDYAPIYLKDVKGYKFIGAHWHEWEGIPDVVPFVKAHEKELRGKKPFFFFEHQQPINSCLGKWAFNPDPYSTEALKTYPNAVAFSGHSHKSLALPYNYWQGEFTSIGTATLCTLCGEYGRENGPQKFRYDNSRSVMQAIRSGYHDHAQGQFVRVYDDFIEIERHDFAIGHPVGGTLVIPLPATRQSAFFYDNQAAASKSPAPFPDGAQVRVDAGRDVFGSYIRLKFPTTRVVQDCAGTADYRIEAVYEEADVVRTLFARYVYSPGIFGPRELDTGEVTARLLRDLFPETGKVRFVVSAREDFGKTNKPIVSKTYSLKELCK